MEELEKRRQAVGLILAIAGILMFSSKAVMVKLAYRYPVEPMGVLLLRMGFALPIYIGIASINYKKNRVKKLKVKDFLGITFLGLTGYYFSSFLDFVGLQYVSASMERLILFSYPTFTVILSYLLLKKPITRVQIAAILITYIGIIIIFGNDISAVNMSKDYIKGSILILICAFTFGFYLTGSNYYVDRVGAERFTSLAMIVSGIAVIIHYLIAIPKLDEVLLYPLPVYGYGIGMALIATVIPSYLMSEAIGRMGASKFSIIGSLGPISTITLAMIFLDETLQFWQYVGGIIIIFGVYLVNTKK